MKVSKLFLRFGVTGVLVLLLLVPLGMINDLVASRRYYREEAVRRVSQSTAGAQTVVGPIRYVPWVEEKEVPVKAEDGSIRHELQRDSGVLVQTPLQLDVVGDLEPAERVIGLFKVPVYTWRANLQAEFAPLDCPPAEGRRYGQPYLAIGLSDVRGLVGRPLLRVDGRGLQLEAGAAGMNEVQGVHALLPGPADAAGGSTAALKHVELELALNGTRGLAIVPAGASNHIAVTSSWPHPLFSGEFLPDERTIDQGGFAAQWSVSALSTGAPADIVGNRRGLKNLDAVRVDLVDPVDIYTQADRASKYGVLFVLLTFVGFGLFELLKRLPIHPMQYLLVGLALALFFLGLLSLSEHMPFWQAYCGAAAACIGLLLVYLAGVLGSWLRASVFSALFAALYGVLYSLLVSEDNALLMGTLLLFGALAVIMWTTRKLDWYEVGKSLR